MDIVTKGFGTARALRGWLIASLICNMGIIVTGAVVRLTGSGLGCPTWPQCTDTSYVPHGEMGIHGVIEFGNRTLTFVLVAAAIAALVAAYRAADDRGLRLACWGVLLGIVGQAIIGGITVRTQLNPYLVGIHLFLSVALIVVCAWTVLRVSGPRPIEVGRGVRWLTYAVFALAMTAIYLGTLVTGSGPHSGDDAAHRTGFDIETVSRVHSASVWLLVAATIAALVVFRKVGAEQSVKATAALLIALAFQGAIGYLQYFTGLPIGVVIAHMIGTTVVTLLASIVLFSNRPSPLR